MLLPSALGFSPHPPVSVYGTGTYKTIAAFLDSMAHTLRYFISLHITSSDCYTADLPITPTSLVPVFPFPAHALHMCPHSSVICGTGISTCCPSATSFDLALGPDLPRADQLYSGNLRYSAEGFSPSLSLLIPAFSLLMQSTAPYGTASSRLRMLLYQCTYVFLASVSCFSPGHFRRRTSRLVSYYALFECMAASEPTS